MRKNFSIANCNICNVEYNKYNNNRTGTCKKCRNKTYQDKYKELRTQNTDGKGLYPLGVNEQRRRYTKIRKEMDKCETRGELKVFYDSIIAEMIELRIWDWCVQKEEQIETRKNVDENGKPKIGRISNTKPEYPNTKEMPE